MPWQGREPAGGEEPPAPGAVVGLALGAVKGLGFDHVFALGLEADSSIVVAPLGAAEVAELVGADRAEQRVRLAETRDFFAFWQREMPALLERWEAHRTGLTERGNNS